MRRNKRETERDRETDSDSETTDEALQGRLVALSSSYVEGDPLRRHADRLSCILRSNSRAFLRGRIRCAQGDSWQQRHITRGTRDDQDDIVAREERRSNSAELK